MLRTARIRMRVSTDEFPLSCYGERPKQRNALVDALHPSLTIKVARTDTVHIQAAFLLAKATLKPAAHQNLPSRQL